MDHTLKVYSKTLHNSVMRVGSDTFGDPIFQEKKAYKIIECIFLSQGRHYDSFPDFTPSSDAKNWCLTDSQH